MEPGAHFLAKSVNSSIWLEYMREQRDLRSLFIANRGAAYTFELETANEDGEVVMAPVANVAPEWLPSTFFSLAIIRKK